jgi:hypothetical protein
MEKEILDKLEKLRTKMNLLAIELGITHVNVIKISQEIDELHNQFNELKIKGEKKPVKKCDVYRHVQKDQVIREEGLDKGLYISGQILFKNLQGFKSSQRQLQMRISL